MGKHFGSGRRHCRPGEAAPALYRFALEPRTPVPELAALERAWTSGAVLYTGAVSLPTGEHYDWQYGVLTGDLLAEEWTGHAAPLVAVRT